ncbi:1580_t:CDS:2, partial [Funneliformis caledonium]
KFYGDANISCVASTPTALLSSPLFWRSEEACGIGFEKVSSLARENNSCCKKLFAKGFAIQMQEDIILAGVSVKMLQQLTVIIVEKSVMGHGRLLESLYNHYELSSSQIT